jgi:hypothetical protein
MSPPSAGRISAATDQQQLGFISVSRAGSIGEMAVIKTSADILASDCRIDSILLCGERKAADWLRDAAAAAKTEAGVSLPSGLLQVREELWNASRTDEVN